MDGQERISQQRTVITALLASIILHSAIILVPIASNKKPITSFSGETLLTISLHYRKQGSPSALSNTTLQPEDTPKELKVDWPLDKEKPETKPVTKLSNNEKKQPQYSKPLDLSLPKFNFEDAEIELTESGAVVFDKRLLKQLKSKQRKNLATKNDHYNRSKLTANGQASLVKFGDKCFEVIEPEPLDSLAREMWFRVDC